MQSKVMRSISGAGSLRGRFFRVSVKDNASHSEGRKPEETDKENAFLPSEHPSFRFLSCKWGDKAEWTETVRKRSMLIAYLYPGVKIMVLSKTYSELWMNHICRWRDLLFGLAAYKDNTKEIIFPNDSRILFRYARNDNDIDKCQGIEVDVLFIDDTSQFSKEQFNRIKTWVRGVNNFPKRLYTARDDI